MSNDFELKTSNAGANRASAMHADGAGKVGGRTINLAELIEWFRGLLNKLKGIPPVSLAERIAETGNPSAESPRSDVPGGGDPIFSREILQRLINDQASAPMIAELRTRIMRGDLEILNLLRANPECLSDVLDLFPQEDVRDLLTRNVGRIFDLLRANPECLSDVLGLLPQEDVRDLLTNNVNGIFDLLRANPQYSAGVLGKLAYGDLKNFLTNNVNGALDLLQKTFEHSPKALKKFGSFKLKMFLTDNVGGVFDFMKASPRHFGEALSLLDYDDLKSFLTENEKAVFNFMKTNPLHLANALIRIRGSYQGTILLRLRVDEIKAFLANDEFLGCLREAPPGFTADMLRYLNSKDLSEVLRTNRVISECLGRSPEHIRGAFSYLKPDDLKAVLTAIGNEVFDFLKAKPECLNVFGRLKPDDLKVVLRLEDSDGLTIGERIRALRDSHSDQSKGYMRARLTEILRKAELET
jgi:hypothetical protein